MSKRTPGVGRFLRPTPGMPPLGGVAAALALIAAPLWASTAAASPIGVSAAASAPQRPQDIDSSIDGFYAARGQRPLWLPGGRPGPEAMLLLELIDTSAVDGIRRDRSVTRKLARALRSARDPRGVQRVDRMMSEAFVNYVRALRRPGNEEGVVYVDPELAPRPPAPRELLEQAAAAPSLEQYLASMGFMHPTYAPLRRALYERMYRSDAERRVLELNLRRARLLPGGGQRHVMVNAPAQRLYVYENGQVIDSMRVVVGKPKHPTPVMSALIRFTSLNPYWNVPPDLAAERLAPNVVKYGLSYLRDKRYQVLSDWSDNAKVIDPAKIDWEAVAAGRVEVRLRQLPGPSNSMGKMKFMFPNRQGIYLHDTPEDELFSEASRLFSGGCIRLEDAPRLGAWLHGRPLKPKGASAEQRVDLPVPVPVYITYLTAVPSGSSIVFMDDIYGRDSARLAQVRQGAVASR